MKNGDDSKIQFPTPRAGGMLGFVVLLFLSTAGQCSQETTELYFEQTPPGDTPVVFAQGVISKENRFEQFLLYSPDGQELTFGVTNADWSAFTLYVMTSASGGWTEPVPAPFMGEDASGLTSCRSFDMNRAFFTAARPAYPPSDVWMSERADTGWSMTKLGSPISSSRDEFEVAISQNGTLYFSSNREGGRGDMDIYRALLVDGGYPTAENLGPKINTKWGDDLPYIAPDESYLIFASDRPGGLGARDLYISFQAGGTWNEAKNLGSPINTEQWDIYPSVSPDGKYLFFARRTGWMATRDSDIYWVSTEFIERLR